MMRYFLAFSGLLCFAAIGAFFLFVPPLLIAMALVGTVALLLTGCILLYWFGVQPELEPAPPPSMIDGKN